MTSPADRGSATGDSGTDAGLMAALQAGNDRALDALMIRWRDRVAAFLMRMTGSPTVSLDLTQETFVRLYQNRRRFRAGASFPAWLFTIAANLARNHARWVRRHPSVSLDAPSPAGGESGLADRLPGGGPAPDSATASSESIAAIRSAFEALPPALREAMALFVDEGMSYQEIGRISGCSAKAAEMRIYRARQILKEALASLRAS